MGCNYSSFTGKCTMWDGDVKGTTYESHPCGWDEEGYCVVEEDPDPSYSCFMYESDNPDGDEGE